MLSMRGGWRQRTFREFACATGNDHGNAINPGTKQFLSDFMATFAEQVSAGIH
jgi:hypothetical protein